MTPVPLPLRPDIRDRLGRLAEAAYPREACGLLIGDDGRGDRPVVTDLVPLPNASARPREAWRIDPGAIPGEQVRNVRVIGFYHSHPDRSPLPSRRDVALAPPGLWQLTIAVPGGRAGARAAWRPSAERAPGRDRTDGRGRATGEAPCPS